MPPLSTVQPFAAPPPRYGGEVRTLFVIVAVLLLGVGYAGVPRLPLFAPGATLTLTRIPPPAVTRMGRLTWLGGARLSGNQAAFGGFSALSVQGDRFTLLSDGGNVVRFRLGADWQPRAAQFGDLPAGPGTGWEKRDRDSESLTLAPDGRAWVGYERANAIWRYAPGLSGPARGAKPPAMRGWNANGGAEAIVRLRDGRFVVFAESARSRDRRGRAGVVFAGDPVVAPAASFNFAYRPAPGFRATDVTQLPGGDLLVLERAWRLPLRFRSRLAIVPLAALRPNGLTVGREVARTGAPWPTENFEGIAATREGGATIVWLVSDNDQDWWRRSYLVKARLD